MLVVNNLKKSFDGFAAVSGARLTVEEGRIAAVIGPNGAGKTTLFNLITGHIRPDAGEIFFKNNNIFGLPPYKICRKGIGRSYQVVNIFSRLTIFQNVQIAVLSHGKLAHRFFYPANKTKVEETIAILESVGLENKADMVCGLLSHGDQKVLELAIALGNRPDLLILDEPTAGMSPEETRSAIALIRKLSSDMGLTILFCEHDMELVFSIADTIMVMHQGKTIIQDVPENVKNDKKVREAYLGAEAEC
jgi:branched-chain amino acid transport system ATP-binding protein